MKLGDKLALVQIETASRVMQMMGEIDCPTIDEETRMAVATLSAFLMAELSAGINVGLHDPDEGRKLLHSIEMMSDKTPEQQEVLARVMADSLVELARMYD